MGVYLSSEKSNLYPGCVLSTYERNGYDDSDFYAVCWDNESEKVVEVLYDTTRCGGYGSATIDAGEDVLKKVYRYYKKLYTDFFDEVFNQKKAKEIFKGDTVVVVRGRKVPKGTVGKVFWIGDKYNIYSKKYERRIGIEVDEERIFLPFEYVELKYWRDRLVKGKKRKQIIREMALVAMPAYSRRYFA